MSQLKTLKQRITSISSITKITSAMRVIAATKLKKVKNHLIVADEYSHTLNHALNVVVRNTDNDKINYISQYGFINQALRLEKNITPEGQKTNLYIIIGSDKGLCGSFNTSVSKILMRTLQNPDKIIVVGKKPYEILKMRHSSKILRYFDVPKDLYSLAANISKTIVDNQHYDNYYICYNHFKNNLCQIATIESLFQIENDSQYTNTHYIFDNKNLLEDIAAQYLIAKLYSLILDSKISEEAMRMVSMDNATQSAKKIIDSITLIFHRKRQNAITMELTEIIAGVEALK